MRRGQRSQSHEAVGRHLNIPKTEQSKGSSAIEYASISCAMFPAVFSRHWAKLAMTSRTGASVPRHGWRMIYSPFTLLINMLLGHSIYTNVSIHGIMLWFGTCCQSSKKYHEWLAIMHFVSLTPYPNISAYIYVRR